MSLEKDNYSIILNNVPLINITYLIDIDFEFDET
jgi:hypothetical protein